jgi:hypothetical protein
MVPGLRLLPEGAATDQVTAELALPLIAAENCIWLPIAALAGLGVTATAGAASLGVTAVLAFIVTSQVTVLAHPLHEEKLLLPELAGAVTVTDVPAS